ncbi:MAG: asparagine synthetase B [Lachnospiraceae bacterium]|jgi:asparagine synthase (glutamine-hydrolysing)|nr:asparagine synthetase B [Lachnospiraceae bacterium]
MQKTALKGYCDIDKEEHPILLQAQKSASGRFSLVINGTIHNYRKMAARLACEGGITKNITANAVFLSTIETYGVKIALSISKGTFACAIYDSLHRTLYLARDRVGEKSLYYGFIDKTFVFASHLDDITAFDGFKGSINTDILGLYFVHGYIPAPYSIYQGIFKLDAGMILEIKTPFREHTTYSYWSMKDTASYGQTHLFQGSRREAADELERLLRETIREQVPSDIQTGAFLSAGIDSTAICALARQELSGEINSFTIGMPPPLHDEAITAKKIAAHLGINHTEHYIDIEDAKTIIPDLGGIYGEPFADASQIPTVLLSRMMKKKFIGRNTHVTHSPIATILCGDGGDELFCGYDSYRYFERVYKKLRRMPYSLRLPLSRLLCTEKLPFSEDNRLRGRLLAMNSVSEIYLNSLENFPLVREISCDYMNVSNKYTEIDPLFFDEPNHQLMLMNMLMYTSDDILFKVDHAVSSTSLATRTPLLDKDIIEFAWSLPIEYKRDDKEGKLVLRDVLYRYVPSEWMKQPKQGFGVPLEKWLKEPVLRDWAEQLISRDTLIRQGFLNPDIVHRIWDDFLTRDYFISQIWSILMFQMFLEERKIS